MTKRVLFGATLLVCGASFGFLSAQEPGTIAGRATLKSTGEGISQVSVTLCPDTGRQVVLVTEGVSRLPARDQVRDIRISTAGETRAITIATVVADCPNARRATTDNTGGFVFSDVVPGPYKLHAQRNGYIGESLRGTPPTVVTQSITVTDRQAVPDVTFYLTKGGAIAGTVLDPNGKPVASAAVLLRASNSPQALLASEQTDDRGQYRLFGLPPGEFIVIVRTGISTTTNSLPDGKTAVFINDVAQPGISSPYAPTYYPGDLSPADAKVIVLREGEEVSGINVVLRTLP